ncbi:MAG: NAD(P)/FAD-dependent oxidoreductase [Actinobacteria bacterium]|nr:NAD(P)/FAD-dependent oxidoreductase [Actinomycetota bacterium]
MSNKTYDVAIIGAGVVGTAIARELARHDLSIALIDANADVGDGTSKANTAILHTGFDMVPGSLESRLVARGYHLLRDYAREVGIAVEELGALLVAWSEEELANLPKLQAKAVENGYKDSVIISAADVYAREPHLGVGALGALHVPGEWIIDPWTPIVAFATQAKLAGADIILNTAVTGVTMGDHNILHTTGGDIAVRYVINAAGLYSDEIDGVFGIKDFTVVARRGELMVFDKLSRTLISHIILPVPSSMGKGVLVSPTVFGNIMLGPTAQNLDDKTDSGSSEDGLNFLREKGQKIAPELLDEEITAIYAGLRASTEHSDFQIHSHPDKYITVGGIRSTGLTASMAIAEHVKELLVAGGLSLGATKALPHVSMPNLGEAFTRPYQDEKAIAGQSAYGEIICHCERATRGEVMDALDSAIPPTTLGGLGRRTRAGLGRCQGFYCHSELRKLLEKK